MKGANKIFKGFCVVLIVIIAAALFVWVFSVSWGAPYFDNQTSSRPDIRPKDNMGHRDVVAHCDDGVICYRPCAGYGCSISCLKDHDLVEKYCKEAK